jgi:hypothetical protein|uniref:Uncharacterized protein n=1 Tax=Mus musculus TaxID=10090 RepID=Q3V1Y1_MOUSE|nr:unnamed protein product [Mus musculus]
MLFPLCCDLEQITSVSEPALPQSKKRCDFGSLETAPPHSQWFYPTSFHLHFWRCLGSFHIFPFAVTCLGSPSNHEGCSVPLPLQCLVLESGSWRMMCSSFSERRRQVSLNSTTILDTVMSLIAVRLGLRTSSHRLYGITLSAPSL